MRYTFFSPSSLSDFKSENSFIKMQASLYINFRHDFIFRTLFLSASARRVPAAMSNMVPRVDGWPLCWVVSGPRKAEEECNARPALCPCREACSACDYVRSLRRRVALAVSRQYTIIRNEKIAK